MTKRKLLSPPQQLAYQHQVPPSLHEDALYPDGVSVVLDWDAFAVGTSVFIPAINHTKLTVQIQKVAKRKGMTLKGFTRIEAGKYGVRFWRML